MFISMQWAVVKVVQHFALARCSLYSLYTLVAYFHLNFSLVRDNPKHACVIHALMRHKGIFCECLHEHVECVTRGLSSDMHHTHSRSAHRELTICTHRNYEVETMQWSTTERVELREKLEWIFYANEGLHEEHPNRQHCTILCTHS